MVDLHVHSTCSDGTFTPEELVDYAIQKGLTAFALTDHDTVNGLDRAIRYADGLRQAQAASPSDAPASQVPEVIPGIELSTEYQGKDIHMVGLFIDYRQPEFAHYLEDFIRSRENRNEKMCALLREHDIDITYEALLAEFPGAVITRAHFARYLLSHGYIQSMKEAFDRYVGDHCPCFVPREKVTPAQAVELILGAGGVPVLAHPILYHMSDDRLDTLVAELKKIGLVGIEAIYSTYNTAEERQIRGLASKYDLQISGGSDFHGANKPKIDLGTGWGKLYVPDEVLENLRPDRLLESSLNTLAKSTNSRSMRYTCLDVRSPDVNFLRKVMSSSRHDGAAYSRHPWQRPPVVNLLFTPPCLSALFKKISTPSDRHRGMTFRPPWAFCVLGLCRKTVL